MDKSRKYAVEYVQLVVIDIKVKEYLYVKSLLYHNSNMSVLVKFCPRCGSNAYRWRWYFGEIMDSMQVQCKVCDRLLLLIGLKLNSYYRKLNAKSA